MTHPLLHLVILLSFVLRSKLTEISWQISASISACLDVEIPCGVVTELPFTAVLKENKDLISMSGQLNSAFIWKESLLIMSLNVRNAQKIGCNLESINRLASVSCAVK